MDSFRLLKNCILFAIGILLNFLGRYIASSLALPFWLDAIGTLVVAILLGPIGGAACGAVTNMIIGIGDWETTAYAIVSIGIGFSVGYYFPKKNPRLNMFAVISTAVFAGIVAVILSTPLNMVFYGGRTGNIWGDGLIDMLSRDIKVPLLCTILGEAFVDIPDKALSVIIAVGIIKAYRTINDRRKNGKKAALWIPALIICSAFLLGRGMSVKAQDFGSDYAPTLYATEVGLDTIEINAIAQTPDGYIWAGTYAGLYRCDGSRFEEIILDDRISNVMVLFVDSAGRLWIGTNDAGIACYNTETKDIVFYSMEEGVPSNSIRSICEDVSGDIYVGTATQLCIIRPEGGVEIISSGELYGTRSLCANAEYVSGVTNAGEIFFIKDRELVSESGLSADNVYFGAVAAGENNTFMAGTSDNYVVMVTPDGNEIVFGKKYSFGDTKYFNKIIRCESEGGFFYCCENGCGFVTNEGKVTDLTYDDFDNAVSDAIIDMQGNIWFSSNKQGIIRYSWNPFQDVFAKAAVEPDVVNSIIIKDGLIYVGGNSGLTTIDMKTYYNVPVEHPALFDGVRIRDIMEDSAGNLWISTYGKDGLIEMCPDGSYTVFNESIKGTIGSRFRFSIELSDGRIAAATTTGINYIEKNKVVATGSEPEGITTQILSMVEMEDGNILAGTDGDGLYVIKDGKVIRRIGQEQGLDSLVILKIIPCGEQEYIFVTSNALYYCKDEIITKLNKFPYKNNYDVFLSNDGDAWISSSAGIFVVNKDDLISNGDYNYTLLNKSRGLYSSLTANAKNAFDGENLYLCCADGVRKIPVDVSEYFSDDYDIKISRLLAGEDEVEIGPDDVYVIPATAGRIQFEVAVLNFTLSNPLLHIYLEGAQDDGITCQQKEIQTLSYLNLPYGDYQLHVQVLDVSGDDVVQEKIFHIRKESQIFERLYFKAYLLFVCILFVVFVGWLIGNIRTNMNSAEQWQKEAKIDPMTGFWNKIFSEQELTRICADNKGILMMVDLDNFKLVNDLHGHDMGDKVLIRFAKSIRSCIRDEDFVGRVGGDEFIVFIHGATDESAVAEKARFLNEEVGKVGVELVGETFSIPLGVSIGAVAVPGEGTDFAELYKKADKALYNVKQNGKHGYALYKGSASGMGESEEVGSDLAGLRMILGERGDNKGAYLVDFDKLQMVYRLFVRMSKRTFVNIWIVQFMVQKNDGGEVSEEVMEKFVDVLTLNLRSNDVVAPNGKNKAIIIMTDTSSQNGQTPIERIMNKWNSTPGVEGYTLTYETEDM